MLTACLCTCEAERCSLSKHAVIILTGRVLDISQPKSTSLTRLSWESWAYPGVPLWPWRGVTFPLYRDPQETLIRITLILSLTFIKSTSLARLSRSREHFQLVLVLWPWRWSDLPHYNRLTFALTFRKSWCVERKCPIITTLYTKK